MTNRSITYSLQIRYTSNSACPHLSSFREVTFLQYNYGPLKYFRNNPGPSDINLFLNGHWTILDMLTLLIFAGHIFFSWGDRHLCRPMSMSMVHRRNLSNVTYSAFDGVMFCLCIVIISSFCRLKITFMTSTSNI
jgi:hypothetical protein